MDNIKISEVKTMLENILWHIEKNRKVLGDTNVLNQVQESLNNIKISEVKTMLENILWHMETNRKVLGDTNVLNQVQESLNNTTIYLERKKNSAR